MVERTARQAVKRHVARLQQIVSCVTGAVANLKGDYRPGDVRAVTLQGGVSVALGPPAHLALSVKQLLRIAQPPGLRQVEVNIVGYSYALRDEAGREILTYHWHPERPGGIAFPHLHLGPGAKVGRHDLAEAHIPTGSIPLEQFLLLAIAELGVRPKRKDWQNILQMGK